MPPKAQPVALRVELQKIEPLIWRRIVVSNQWTFGTLHNYLQWVLGWQDSHAHEFRVGERCIGPDWWIQEIELDGGAQSYQDERRVSIAAVVRELDGVGGEFEYHYDMGDGWVHRCIIKMTPAPWLELELRTPACTAGENACPPEESAALMAMLTSWSASATDRIPSMRTRFDGSVVCSIRKDSISIVLIGIGSRGGEALDSPSSDCHLAAPGGTVGDMAHKAI